jgi:hypothetical protein
MPYSSARRILVRKKTKAYFAVKRRGWNSKEAPILVAIVESYDAAIEVAERYNDPFIGRKPFYATVHHG